MLYERNLESSGLYFLALNVRCKYDLLSLLSTIGANAYAIWPRALV